MEFSLPSAVVGAGLAAAILAVAMMVMSRGPKASPGLALFGVAFALAALRYGAVLWGVAGFAHAPVLIEILHVGMAVFLIAGSVKFLGKTLPGVWLEILWLVLSAWVVFALYGLKNPFLMEVVVYGFSGVVMLGTGVVFLKARRDTQTPGYAVIALFFILWGLHKFDYPWLSRVDWFRPFGFLIAEVLAMSLAVTIIIVAQRNQRAMAESALASAAASDAMMSASERRLGAILETMADGVVVATRDGKIETYNPGAESIFGYAAAEVIGGDIGVILCENPVGGGLGTSRQGALLAAREGTGRCEITGRTKDGRLVAVEIDVNTLEIGGEPLLVSVMRDISDRKLDHAIEDVLHRMMQLVLEGQGMKRVASYVCDRLADILDLPLVWVARSRPDGSVAVHAVSGRGGDYLSSIDVRWDDTPNGRGPVGLAIRLDRPQVMDPTASGTDFDFTEALKAGFRSIAAIPLRTRSQVVGAINFYSYDGFDPHLVQRMEAFAMRLGVAAQMAEDQKFLNLQGAAMAEAANAIFITDSHGKIEWINRAFTRLSGYDEREVLGKIPHFLKSDPAVNVHYRHVRGAVIKGEAWQGEMMERHKDGSVYTVDQTITPMPNPAGSIKNFVVVQEDITERKRAEARIRYLSSYDPLTALPNRSFFRERLGQAVAKAEAQAQAQAQGQKGAPVEIALLVLDLDHFSRINDSLGHDAGDRLMKSIVERLVGAARAAATIGRIGGDEFAIVLEQSNADAAAALAGSMIEAINRPFEIDGQEVHVGCSVGITMYPADSRDPAQLMRNADVAMYRAMREAAGGYCFYSNDMNIEISNRLNLERDLRRAQARREFVVHYQPLVAVADGALMGLEAMVRWDHPQRGLIAPIDFIPIAEESGLIAAISEWVLSEVCNQIRDWEKAGLTTVPVSVNLSVLQFGQRNTVEMVARILEETGCPAGTLQLGLTETAIMADPAGAETMLHGLAELGLRLAIDDFGTGYSSLSYLKRFPVQMLKMDRAFITDVSRDADNGEIARAIIGLGHSLDMMVVSEGVDTVEQFAYLRHQGCDVVQGALFAAAMPAPQAKALLAAKQPAFAGLVPQDETVEA